VAVAESTAVPVLHADAEARRLVAAARTHGRARRRAVTTALAVATFVVICVSVSVGEYTMPLSDVIAGMLGFGDRDATFVVQELRLPRAVCGLLVGLALGISGAVFQTTVRNELASPDVIGITAGAGTAAVLMIVVWDTSSVSLSLAALMGALGTALAIYLLAYKRGVAGYRLILVGIGVQFGLTSVTSYLLTRAEIEDVQRAAVWLAGSLNGRGWEQATPLACAMAVLVPLILLLTRGLRALELGDDTAKGIGVPVERMRAVIIIAAASLAAFATAAAGPVAFVAFVSAPIARRLVGGGDVVLIASALTGALLLVAADLVGRKGLGSIELPVGILTGIIGAPYLLWLLTTTNRAGAGD
jgi:iron complex transport system permease protein